MLLPVDDFPGNNTIQCFLQYVFGCESSKFQVRWDACSKFKQFVVEKRTACLKRVGHAHAVGLHEKYVVHIMEGGLGSAHEYVPAVRGLLNRVTAIVREEPSIGLYPQSIGRAGGCCGREGAETE